MVNPAGFCSTGSALQVAVEPASVPVLGQPPSTSKDWPGLFRIANEFLEYLMGIAAGFPYSDDNGLLNEVVLV